MSIRIFQFHSFEKKIIFVTRLKQKYYRINENQNYFRKIEKSSNAMEKEELESNRFSNKEFVVI